MDTDELDEYVRHTPLFPVVSRIMGGTQAVRFSEFNFREVPCDAPSQHMKVHRDRVLQMDGRHRSPIFPP